MREVGGGYGSTGGGDRGGRRWSVAAVALAAVLAFGLLSACKPQVPARGTTTRVSVASDGTQGNRDSTWGPAISADGRFVAFQSGATNLVAADTNGRADVFVHDRTTGTTTRVSTATGGTEANGDSFWPAVSGDGRYVAFVSLATNLVSGDTNATDDVFVHDRSTGSTERVSVASDGAQAGARSWSPSISDDGRFVSFGSAAWNLVAGDTNGVADAFVRDRVSGTTSRTSVSSDGTQADGESSRPRLTGDGRYVAFTSGAKNLVAGDTNNRSDVFVNDRSTGTTIRVSLATDGAQGAGNSQVGSISGDGRYVTFESESNLDGTPGWVQDIYVHDRSTGITSRVGIAHEDLVVSGFPFAPTVSGDGRFVTFNFSLGWNEYDAFLHDRQTGRTEHVALGTDGAAANGWSTAPSISANGRGVVFESDASNLVAGDTNGRRDVFVYELPVS